MITAKRIAVCLFLLVASVTGTGQSCSDPKATKETETLYRNLLHLAPAYTMFGHQDALAYGVGWENKTGKSDIKDVVNDYPAVYGWDIGHLELNAAHNLDSVPFDRIRQYIRDGHGRGAVITVSWHLDNPLTGKSAWDTTAGSVSAIIPGGARHTFYKGWLDKVAAFMNGLKDSEGKLIPVLFRPYHELTGNWFWWCKNMCSPAEFKALWRFTVDYLRNQKGLHHLLYVYNTADFTDENDFLERYPGDDVVDVLSFDRYQYTKEEKGLFISDSRKRLGIVAGIAKQKHKLVSLAETGFEAIPDGKWWTKVLWPAIKGLPVSYVLVWRNAGYMPSLKKMHYYAPYKGQLSEKDFRKFYQLKQILFEKRTREKELYKQAYAP